MTDRPAPVSITVSAAERVKALLAQAGKPVEGLRVGVKNAGCSGLSYTLDYAETVEPGEEVIEQNGVRLIIDPAAFMFLIGTEIDYTDDPMGASFKFNNPNAKDTCGCGESFRV